MLLSSIEAETVFPIYDQNHKNRYMEDFCLILTFKDPNLHLKMLDQTKALTLEDVGSNEGPLLRRFDKSETISCKTRFDWV